MIFKRFKNTERDDFMKILTAMRLAHVVIRNIDLFSEGRKLTILKNG